MQIFQFEFDYSKSQNGPHYYGGVGVDFVIAHNEEDARSILSEVRDKDSVDRLKVTAIYEIERGTMFSVYE